MRNYGKFLVMILENDCLYAHRYGHASAVVGSRMYMFGGISEDNAVKYHNDMFILHRELVNDLYAVARELVVEIKF